jgi:hypothetical protein
MSEYALFRWAEVPFAGGSDHFILTDPTVGIPCPMLLQWPDKFYHTSADTIDKVDPAMLARVGVAAAAYLWWFAMAGPREVAWLGPAVVSRAEATLGRLRQGWLDELLARDPTPTPEELAQALGALQRRLRMRVEQRVASLALLQRLAGQELAQLPDWQAQVDAAGEREMQRAWAAMAELFDLAKRPDLPAAERDEWEERAATMIPRRLGRGPLMVGRHRGRLSPEDREAWRQLHKEHGRWGGSLLAIYWTDGRRSLLDIANLVEDECGQRGVEALVHYYKLLEKMGLVEVGRKQ